MGSDKKDESMLVPHAAKAVLEGAPKLLAMLFPKWAAKADAHQSISRFLIETAAQNPAALTDADIAMIDAFLTENAANWVKYRYVDAQADAAGHLLSESPLFMLPRDPSDSDPSFSESLKAGIRSTDLDDKRILDMYASIKAGEHVRPGTFSKLTCQAVSTLSKDAIDALELTAKHVVRFGEPPFPVVGVPTCAVQSLPGQTRPVKYSTIMDLRDHGLAYASIAQQIVTPDNPLCLLFGTHVREYSIRLGQRGLGFYPLTISGNELMQIHQTSTCAETMENVTSELREHRRDMSIRSGRLSSDGSIVWESSYPPAQ